MELHKLESEFFHRVLNAELDIPVHGTLTCGDSTFDVIIIPEISSQGEFTLRYYNAPPPEPKVDVNENGERIPKRTWDEIIGIHPVLNQAWIDNSPVNLQIQRSSSVMSGRPRSGRSKRDFDTRVHYLESENRGVLRLNDNRIALQATPVKNARFAIVGLPDFKTPELQWRSIAAIGSTEQEQLRSIADLLEEGASIQILPTSHRVTLAAGVEWIITLTRDEDLTRGMISHTGSIEKPDGSEFEVEHLILVLEALNYFFAFISGTYCQPTAVVAHDGARRRVWGRVGRFTIARKPVLHWFRDYPGAPLGKLLEALFPLFWEKWNSHRDEIIAIVSSYVESNAISEAGVPQDATAKSFVGLEILASLITKKTIQSNPSPTIDEVLCQYSIPHRTIEAETLPLIKALCDDLEVETKGAYLINEVRNYVMHPLDRKRPARVKEKHVAFLDSDPIKYAFVHDLSQFYLEYTLLEYCGLLRLEHRELLK